MDVATQRGQAVSSCLAEIRDIIKTGGIGRESVERVKNRLFDLAEKRDLFNSDQFSVQEGDGLSSLYLLSEDEDHGYALYVVAQKKGNISPAHNHTTWAVIVGIEGQELNHIYERFDDGSVPGRADVREVRTEIVDRGSGVAFLDNDIHSIQCINDEPTINFHLYGVGIEQQTRRTKYNMADGTYRIFAASPAIHR